MSLLFSFQLVGGCFFVCRWHGCCYGVKQLLFSQIRVLVALNGLVSGGERWQRLLKVTPPHSTLHKKVPLVHIALTELSVYLSTRLQVARPINLK